MLLICDRLPMYRKTLATNKWIIEIKKPRGLRKRKPLPPFGTTGAVRPRVGLTLVIVSHVVCRNAFPATAIHPCSKSWSRTHSTSRFRRPSTVCLKPLPSAKTFDTRTFTDPSSSRKIRSSSLPLRIRPAISSAMALTRPVGPLSATAGGPR